MVAETVLTPEQWRPRADAHAARADAATAGHRERAPRHEPHAVEDFLYDYYSVRPQRLRRWHPGIGVGLADAPDHASWRHYATRDGVTAVDPQSFWEARGATVEYVEALLRATSARQGRRNCFGLHEWAMVYRADTTRHVLPLRLGGAGTDAVVEAHPIACTHLDAFRFFTPPAVPLNAVQLTRDTQIDHEQPACLHANMDLYKWSSKLAPAVPSDLIQDAFELAMRVRYLDMRASPYDVRALGLEPVPIETPEGRREYAALQADFAAEASALRERLIDACVAIREAAAGRAG